MLKVVGYIDWYICCLVVCMMFVFVCDFIDFDFIDLCL